MHFRADNTIYNHYVYRSTFNRFPDQFLTFYNFFHLSTHGDYRDQLPGGSLHKLHETTKKTQPGAAAEDGGFADPLRLLPVAVLHHLSFVICMDVLLEGMGIEYGLVVGTEMADQQFQCHQSGTLNVITVDGWHGQFTVPVFSRIPYTVVFHDAGLQQQFVSFLSRSSSGSAVSCFGTG